MPVSSFADLVNLSGFDHVADKLVTQLFERLEGSEPARGPSEMRDSEVLIRAAAAIFQVPPHAKLASAQKAVRSLPIGHLARLWRQRPPRLARDFEPRVHDALARFERVLAELINHYRPPPLDLPPALAAMRLGIFRRRLARFLPEFYRELGLELSYASDHLPVGEWAINQPPRGPSASSRKTLERLAALLVERATDPDQDRRLPELVALATPRERPLVELASEHALAPTPPPDLRPRGTWIADVDARTVTLTLPAFDACLAEVCDAVTCHFTDPRRPLLQCSHGRNRPCSLKRLFTESVLEAALGRGSLPAELRDAVREIVTVDVTDILLKRLKRASAPVDDKTPEGATLGWLYHVGEERLDLVWLSQKKKGGLKAKKVPRSDASAVLKSPAHHLALALADTRYIPHHLDYFRGAVQLAGPALAALAGDPAVYVHAPPDEIAPARVQVHTPQLAPLQEANTLRFAVALGPLRLSPSEVEHVPWLVRFDGRDTLHVGVVSASLQDALMSVAQLGPVEVDAQRQAEVAESLLSLERRVPLAPDGSWLGERIGSDHRWVLKLEFGGPRGARSVRAELGLRIVPELGVLVPGEGTETIPVRRTNEVGEPRLAHVVRDFGSECAEGRDLAERLGLSLAAGGWSDRLEVLEEALALLSRAQDLSNVGQLELVWASKPVQIQRAKRPDKLQLELGLRKDWLDMNGGYVLDGGELPIKELLEGLRQNKRFIEVDEATIVELDEELKRALLPLTALAREQSGRVIASPLAAPLVDELEKTGVHVEAPTEWLELNERLDEALTLSPTLPPLTAELRPYQVEGFTWMMRLAHWARGACLADDMGLGKTLQALAFILARAERGPTLVVAPTSVVPNWAREASKFAPSLEVSRVLQGHQLDAALAALGPGVVIVTTWDLLVRHEAKLQNVAQSDGTFSPWPTVVLDEAHAIKNASTRRAQAARSLDADFVLALTGTPVENRPMELWSLFSVVAPGLLGSAESFRDRFARPIEEKSPTASRALARLVRPFLLRRTKGEVATDLPAKTEIRVDVILDPDERERYQKVRMAAVKELDRLTAEESAGQRGLIRILAVLTRLRQLACHPRLVDPKAPASSSKLVRLVELADELRGEGRKMLVFSQFTELLGLVRDAFEQAEITHVYLDGSTPGTERERLVNRFQSGEVDAFLLSLKAGGVGLNLTMATEVIHLDPWWNPAVEDQASDRAYRIGQDKPVTVYRLVANGTIEEQILSLHADKRVMVSSLLEGTASTQPITSDEMLSLLMGFDEAPSASPEDPPATPEEPSASPRPSRASALLADSPDELGREPPSSPPQPPVPPPSSGDELIARTMSALTRNPLGLGKAELLTATGLPEVFWPDLRNLLAAHPSIEVVGQRRSTRYRLKAPPTPSEDLH